MYEMTPEQKTHSAQNSLDFSIMYNKKYENGAKEHGGVMWTMGAYQALQNMEDEVQDQWSYARQIRRCLDDIKKIVELYDGSDGQDGWRQAAQIKEILNRVKED